MRARGTGGGDGGEGRIGFSDANRASRSKSCGYVRVVAGRFGARCLFGRLQCFVYAGRYVCRIKLAKQMSCFVRAYPFDLLRMGHFLAREETNVPHSCRMAASAPVRRPLGFSDRPLLTVSSGGCPHWAVPPVPVGLSENALEAGAVLGPHGCGEVRSDRIGRVRSRR